MTALDRNPSTIDNLLPNRYRFFLKRAPNVEFTCQEIIIPGFSIPNAIQPSPFVDIPHSGEHITYESLGIEFIVDEKLANYTELYAWLRGLGKPDNFGQYAALLAPPAILEQGPKSEIFVTLLDGQQKPQYQFTFHDAFPVALGQLRIASNEEGLDRIVCHCEFKYTSFDLDRMGVPVIVPGTLV